MCLAATLATACGGNDSGAPGNIDDTRPFAGVDQDDVLQLIGTEPFWGGEVRGSVMTYTTPDNPAGETVTVESFGGRGGLSFSGQMGAGKFDMTVTPGKCSDGMSDRIFPYVVMLRLPDESRNGCGWTNEKPFTEISTDDLPPNIQQG